MEAPKPVNSLLFIICDFIESALGHFILLFGLIGITFWMLSLSKQQYLPELKQSVVNINPSSTNLDQISLVTNITPNDSTSIISLSCQFSQDSIQANSAKESALWVTFTSYGQDFNTSANDDEYVDEHGNKIQLSVEKEEDMITFYKKNLGNHIIQSNDLYNKSDFCITSSGMWNPTNSRNPYICMWLGIKLAPFVNLDALEDNGLNYIAIDYNSKDTTGRFTEPLNILNISPQPDQLRPDRIIYHTPESIRQVIDNGGIYLIAENINIKRTSQHVSFIASLIAGAALSLIAQIIINLIKKGRIFFGNKMKK